MRPGELRNAVPTVLPYGQAAQALRVQPPNGYMPGMGSPTENFHQPGGDTLNRLLHPSFIPMERMNRVLPEESWFDSGIGPESPVQFEILSFQVPKNLTLWLFDYEFTVYLQSGLDPFDFVPAMRQRFSGQMGFDLQVGANKRLGNLIYQLDPAPVPTTKFVNTIPFGGSTTSHAAFDNAAAANFSSVASQGSALLPVRSEVQGPRNGVFTLIGEETEQISLQCVIFRALTTPIACIEAKFGGYLLNDQVSRAIISRMRPQ